MKVWILASQVLPYEQAADASECDIEVRAFDSEDKLNAAVRQLYKDVVMEEDEEDEDVDTVDIGGLIFGLMDHNTSVSIQEVEVE